MPSPLYGSCPQEFRDVPYFKPLLINEEYEWVEDANDGREGREGPPLVYTQQVDEYGQLVYDEETGDPVLVASEAYVGWPYYWTHGLLDLSHNPWEGWCPRWKLPASIDKTYDFVIDGETVGTHSYSWSFDAGYRLGARLRKEKYPFYVHEVRPPNTDENPYSFPISVPIVYCSGEPAVEPEGYWPNYYRTYSDSYPIHYAKNGRDCWEGYEIDSLEGLDESTWFIPPVINEAGTEVPNPNYIGHENRRNLQGALGAYFAITGGYHGSPAQKNGWEIHQNHWHKYKVAYDYYEQFVNVPEITFHLTEVVEESKDNGVSGNGHTWSFKETQKDNYLSYIYGIGAYKKCNDLQIGKQSVITRYELNSSASDSSASYKWAYTTRLQASFYSFDRQMHPKPEPITPDPLIPSDSAYQYQVGGYYDPATGGPLVVTVPDPITDANWVRTTKRNGFIGLTRNSATGNALSPNISGPRSIGGEMEWVFREYTSAGLLAEEVPIEEFVTEVKSPSFQSY